MSVDADKAADVVNTNEAKVNLTDGGTKTAIAHVCMLYGSPRPVKGTTEFKMQWANKLSNNLNMVASLTGNMVISVALCLDQSEVTSYNLAAKTFEVPKCYVNSVDTTQGILTRFAEKCYERYCITEKEAALEHHRKTNTAFGHSLYHNTEVYKHTSFPSWKEQIQPDYGVVARYFHQFWYLNPKMNRVEAFNEGMRKLFAECTTKNGPQLIIKNLQDQKRKEYCMDRLAKVMDDPCDDEQRNKAGEFVLVVKDNDLFQELLVKFFALFKIKNFNKQAPDLLLCLQEYLMSPDVSLKHHKTFEKFLEFVPKHTPEYLEKCHEIQEKLDHKALLAQKKLDQEQIRIQNAELAEQKRTAKAAELKEREERKKLLKMNHLSSSIAKAVEDATGGTRTYERSTTKDGGLTLGEIPLHNAVTLCAPRPKLTAEGHPIFMDDGISYSMTAPGLKWVQRMRKGITIASNFVDHFLLVKGLNPNDFVDPPIISKTKYGSCEMITKGVLGNEAALVLMAIMFLQEKDPTGKDADEDYVPWLAEQPGIAVAQKAFVIYARDMIKIWLDDFYAAKLPSTFAAFHAIVAPGFCQSKEDKAVIWKQIGEILADGELVTASAAAYLKQLCVTLLKIQYSVDNPDVEGWPEEATMTMQIPEELKAAGSVV